MLSGHRLAGLLLAAALAAPVALTAAETALPTFDRPPTPYSADYRLLRNDGQIATLTRSLQCDGARCRYRQHGRATGLARLLTGGGELDEQSHFTLEQGQLRPQRYTYRERLFGRERLTDLRFDHRAGTVASADGSWQQALGETTLDGLLAQLALALALEQGVERLALEVIEQNGRSRAYRFRVVGQEPLTTRAGTLQTVRVEYLDPHRPERTTEVWFARHHANLPARIDQQREDGTRWRYEVTALHTM